MKALTYVVAALLVLGASGTADEPATVDWTDLPGTDGKAHSLSEWKGKDVVVVAITRDRCPVAVSYFGKMSEFAATQSRAALVAINLDGSDDLPGMTRVAQERAFKFPYLRDAGQAVGRRLGARSTPEFFVLDRDRRVVYRGAWDDGQPDGRVKDRYVEAAVEAALAGRKPAVAETVPVGCSIRYAADR